jgi:replicative DNA helicase
MNDDTTILRDRMPPHSIEAEVSVLGSMLIDVTCIPLVQAQIGADAFYQADHQIIWDAIMGLYRAGKPIDAVTVREQLLVSGRLEEIGGTPYLGQLLHAVPSAAHAEYYAKIVRNKAARRAMIRAGTELVRSAFASMQEEDEEVPALAMKAATGLIAIGTQSVSDGFRAAADLASDVIDDLVAGRSGREPVGIRDFDETFGGLPIGGFTMIAARPSMGKSLVAMNFALQMSRPRIAPSGEERPGLTTCVISVEDTSTVVAGRLLSRESGVANHHISYGALRDGELGRLGQAVTSLSQSSVFITDAPLRLSEVEAAILLAKSKYGAGVVIVDYLQLIDDELGTDNENRQITEISRRLKFAFKKAGVVGIACVQLNRGSEMGEVPPPPTLKNLRGSGSLEQDADVVIALHGQDYYKRREPGYMLTHRLELWGLKNKGGPLGTVTVYHDNQSMLIRNRTQQEQHEDEGATSEIPFS